MARTELRLTLVLVAALSGCSLVVQDVTLPACTDDAECEPLNLSPGEKLISRCQRYQCSGGSGMPGVCIYRPRDADDDGHIDAMCPDGDDCNDAVPAIFEGNTEICDGLDNDCDLVIDDGDFTGAGPAEVLDVMGAESVAWGAPGGRATYSTSMASFVFAMDGEGRITSAPTVEGRVNQGCMVGVLACEGSGRTVLTDQSIGTVSQCYVRAAAWLNATECSLDTECPQPGCMEGAILDGGTRAIGRCNTVDGGNGGSICRNDSDCDWPCATERCVPPLREDDIEVRAPCTLFDLTTAAIGPTEFAVGIETNGCSEGRLHVGVFDPGARSHLLMYGPEARSNVWLGVDVGAFGPRGCTGDRRVPRTPGVASPAIAALGPEAAPEALAVYLGDTRERNRCGDTVPVPVEGLALIRETGARALNTWVTASNNGHPETFGQTNGGGPPGVAAVGELGWVVGYPQAAASGGTPIALHFVGKATRPRAFTETLDDGGIWPGHLRRETAPIMPGDSFFEVPATGRADYVHVAVGALRGTTYDVGVTWMEGCSGEDLETVWFSLVRFDPAAPTRATATAPLQLSTSAAHGGFPAIVYAAAPFVSPGWMRDGGAPVAPDALSGFVVAWSGAGRLAPRASVYAIRVSESDGLPIDPAPQTLDAIPMVATQAASVTLYATPTASGAVSYGYWDRTTSVGGGRLVCTPL